MELMEISGTIEKGNEGKGHEGFPTANIVSGIPKGTYVGTSMFGHCVIFVFNGYARIHFIGFTGDVVGEEVTIKNLKKIPDYYKGI